MEAHKLSHWHLLLLLCFLARLGKGWHVLSARWSPGRIVRARVALIGSRLPVYSFVT